MPKLAVDIVLLPPEEIMELAISLNRKLKEKDELKLNAQDCLPHISLSMGTIEQKDLKNVEKSLKDIASHTKPLKLATKGIKNYKSSNKKNISWLSVENTKELQNLHNIVMSKMSSHFSHEAKARHYLLSKDQSVPSWLTKYVEEFWEKHAFEHYAPHITLGFGNSLTLDKEDSFTVSRIAICHMGMHNTCKKILCELPLGK